MTPRTCPAELIGLEYPCGRAADPKSPSGLCTFDSEVVGERRGRNTAKVVRAGDEAMLRPGVPAKPGHRLCSCGCGDPLYSSGLGYACYHVEYRKIRKARRLRAAERLSASGASA